MNIPGAIRRIDGSFEVPNWLVELAERNQTSDPLGRVGRIDAAVRMRGIQEVLEGQCESLARDLQGSGTNDSESFSIDKETHTHGQIVTSSDTITISCHGTECTHIDGLNHFGALNSWFGGSPYEAGVESPWSIDSWAKHGIVTRCWLLDLVKDREEDWIRADKPVTGEELQAVIDRDAINIEPGDALLVYMGRDRYEAEGNTYLPTASAPGGRPGLAPSAGHWIAASDASIVCWDFMDGCGQDIGNFGVHLLIWAVGLALVDNCDLRGIRAALAARGRSSACLIISPLSIKGGTGSAVTPIVLL